MNVQIVHRILSGEEKTSLVMQEITAVKEGYSKMQHLLCDQGSFDEKKEIKMQTGIIMDAVQPFDADNALDERFVRAALLARFSTFLWGNSGVHFDVVLQIMHFLNKGIIPYVPVCVKSERSDTFNVWYDDNTRMVCVADANMIRSAHLAAALMGEGMVFYQGAWCNAVEAIKKESMYPLQLRLRDGYALLAGAPFERGASMLFVDEVSRMLSTALVLSFGANEMAGTSSYFITPEAIALKKHWGQQQVAASMRHLAASSSCLGHGAATSTAPETASSTPAATSTAPENFVNFSLWHSPQYLGAMYDTWETALNAITNEYNSIDDYCAIDADGKKLLFSGNSSAEVVVMEMEKLYMLVNRLGYWLQMQTDDLQRCSSGNSKSKSLDIQLSLGNENAISLICEISASIGQVWKLMTEESLILAQWAENNSMTDKLSDQTGKMYKTIAEIKSAGGNLAETTEKVMLFLKENEWELL